LEAPPLLRLLVHAAYMQLSLLALVVIPELRISDMGIVDVRTFEVVGVERVLIFYVTFQWKINHQ